MEIPKPVNRKPAVAGQFYPSDPEILKNDLSGYFRNAVSKPRENIFAIISPHAGYVFSGQIAAEAFSAINPEQKYQHIFVLAPSHRSAFEGASVYARGNYETPLGEVLVDRELGLEIITKNKVMSFSDNAHLQEHSLEVQLPFLQYRLKNEFKIVPIIIGTQSPEICRQIAAVLKPYFTSGNLFIISSDFSHYPKYTDAKLADSLTAEKIISNNPNALIQFVNQPDHAEMDNLATHLCGIGPVLTLMYMTKNQESYKYEKLRYQNSGDTPYGDKYRVVGYWAIGVTCSDPGFSLNEQEKELLLHIARQTLENHFNDKDLFIPDDNTLSPNLNQPLGAFVSLYNGDDLGGCIGRFEPGIPLYKVVSEMALAAATQDHRFSPVTKKEISSLRIEISVLTPMKKISDYHEIVLGKHGIYIRKGLYGGTFLPQVADKTGWTLEEFLGHCARDKAGIGWDGWKNAEIYTYEAIVFCEHNK